MCHLLSPGVQNPNRHRTRPLARIQFPKTLSSATPCWQSVSQLSARGPTIRSTSCYIAQKSSVHRIARTNPPPFAQKNGPRSKPTRASLRHLSRLGDQAFLAHRKRRGAHMRKRRQPLHEAAARTPGAANRRTRHFPARTHADAHPTGPDQPLWAITPRRTCSSRSTRLTPSRMCPIPETPETAASIPEESSIPSTWIAPRIASITAVRFSPT